MQAYMKITIQGQDYTAALDAAHPLTIERSLNEPSTCRLWLSLPPDGSMAAPGRNQSIAITGDDGTCYFTGYIAVSPLLEYAGLGMQGPSYRVAIQAISDELLLDQLSMVSGNGAAGSTAGALIRSLVTKTGAASLSAQGLTLSSAVNSFAQRSGESWSRKAGKVANEARASYRAMNGSLALAQIPAAIHSLNESDGSLSLADLSLTATARRTLANDITVCGEHEPAAYVTEFFLGDGVTTQFNLGAAPYLAPSSQSSIIRELFNESAIDVRVWGNPGGSGYLSLGAGGLQMQGGSGTDGDTLLSWLDPVEMGGTLLLEATGVTLANGSNGILAGFFVGLCTQASCTAGFQVTAQQGTGSVALQPIVQGVPTGTKYLVNPANQYALRVRVHCPECERALSVYRAFNDDGLVTAGGQSNLSAAKLQFELQEFVNGVAGMPVTLYEGSIASLPGSCTVVAASSISLIGTMRALNLTNLGSGWVVSTPTNGGPRTRRIGSAIQAAECHLESAGQLIFYNGFAPASGEQIAVSYRTVGRAVGRTVNAASQQQLLQAGLPAMLTWIGTVASPAARSSQDCRNAALALGQAAASVSALWSGAYKATNASFAADVWPGDALHLNAPSANMDAQVVVRKVKLSYRASYPDLVEYLITFANDWADDLAIGTSEAVPADGWLPAPVAPVYLPNLNSLAVTSLNGSSVTINTGASAPTGGGFEIRRRDHAFMPSQDTDLVMRGAQSTMMFTRVSACDCFYIRMYDGATPPNYSEFSAALFFNLPLGL
jgi:hypothetical protein